jgi:hypothetical protein
VLKPVLYIVIRDKFYVDQTKPELGPVISINTRVSANIALECAKH